MQSNTKRATTLAMLAALSLISMLLIRFPMFMPFLSYDPKDVVIIIGGFMYGPLAAMLIIVVVSLVEMVTVSDTGFIGLVMNIIASASFAIPAVLIYRQWRNLKSAVIGLIVGVITVTTVMLLWNYLIVPLYMPHITREAVLGMLVPIFLPFNLVKGSLNAAIVMMLYKPVSIALNRAGLYQSQSESQPSKSRLNIWVLLVSLLAVIALVIIMFTQGAV